MTRSPQATNIVPWLAMRQASGLSQREVERRLGWQENRGRLSQIERGVAPTPEQEEQLRGFYGRLLLGEKNGLTG